MGKRELKVLVVEDDAVDYKSVERTLSRSDEHSYVLARAKTMENGKRLLEAKDFDAVILDLGLPDAQGADSVLNFKASSPATPIVVLSGLEDLDAELGSLGISSENFLPKSSLSCSLLEEKIHTALKKHQYKLEAVAQSLEQDPESTQPSPEELRKFAAALRSGPLRALALPVVRFECDETVAYKLRFSFHNGDQVDQKAIQISRESGCLESLSMACVQRALEFSRHFPGSRLHLDLEIEALHPDFVAEMLSSLFSLADRGSLSFFLPAHFGEEFHEQASKAAATLAQAGIAIGVRDVRGGSSLLKNLAVLKPSWIRLSPLLSHGLADFKIKRDYLRHWASILGGQGAHLLADQVVPSDFSMLEGMGLSGAVLR